MPAPEVKTDVHADTLTNACKPQTEINRQHGAKCENDGYTLMEEELHYRRLVQPPKGKGLDGLFEYHGSMRKPRPMPSTVSHPPPGGTLVFIPETMRPPKPPYAALNSKATSPAAYPLFVVFEAKHISKGFDPDDTDGIRKEARRRLGETCNGTQMSEPWSEERIPRALRRSVKSGDMTPDGMDGKITEIKTARYARWMFICLPGGAGTGSKLFVLIDVVASGMDLDKSSVTPEPAPPQPGTNTF